VFRAAELFAQIKSAVKDQNDITLEELIEKLSLPIKKSRLSVVLIKEGLSLKKLHPVNQTRAYVVKEREEWKNL
jgi:transposase